MPQPTALRRNSPGDHLGWVTALVAQHRGGMIPPRLVAGLETRLARCAVMDVLALVEALAGEADRRLPIQLYTLWLRACSDSGPGRYAVWYNLGTEYSRAGDPTAAAQAFAKALALKPDFHAPAINLGIILADSGKREEALAVWAKALQSDEARTALLNQRSRVLDEQRRYPESLRELRASLLTVPDQPEALMHWIHLRLEMCQWPVLEPPPGVDPAALAQSCGPFDALLLSDDIAEQTRAGAYWLGRKTVPVPVRLAPAQGYRHDRVRIGYLSSDFRDHALANLTAELFAAHDRSRFEVYGYCIGRDDGSAMRARIRTAFDHFTVLTPLSDEQAARAIAADEIDILVDLNGLTAEMRLQILRWRPAPVQATFLGFVGPVPLPELDYLFCDRFVIPPAQAAGYRPQPLPVAEIYQPNLRHQLVGPPTSRAAEGLPVDGFVFCCFAAHRKITAEMFAGWMTILRAVPDAVLWLIASNPHSLPQLRAQAAAHGIAAARLVFATPVELPRYLARLAIADLFLDTYPYNSGTVASDALRMGLPLLTLRGRSFAARMAARLLDAIGAEEGITHTMADYVARAIALATDPARFAAFRSRCSGEAWAATMGDVASFTAQYEASLLRVLGRDPGA